MNKKLLRFFSFVLLCATLSCVICSPAYAAIDESLWSESTEELTDYAFSFAFVGDTQILTRKHPTQLDALYKWIAENAEDKRIKFVAGSGDITDHDTEEEWNIAVNAIKQLDGIVPYAVVRGNHDGPINYTKFMSYDTHVKQIDEMYQDNIMNYYQTITIGTLKYMFLCLNDCAGDDVLEWASNAVKSRPDHNVIMVTHRYLASLEYGSTYIERQRSDSTSGNDSANAGYDIWSKFVSKHENIVMVVCGHVNKHPEILTVEAAGDKGNLIQQCLIDPSDMDKTSNGGPVGLVAMFYFSADGKQITVQNYSTVKNMYYGPSLTLELNSVGGNANEEPFPTAFVTAAITGTCLLTAAVVCTVIIKKKKKASNDAIVNSGNNL